MVCRNATWCLEADIFPASWKAAHCWI